MGGLPGWRRTGSERTPLEGQRMREQEAPRWLQHSRRTRLQRSCSEEKRCLIEERQISFYMVLSHSKM